MPQAGDEAVRQVTVAPVQPKKVEKTVEPEVEPEEVQEIIEKEQIQKQKAKPDLTTHSDNVKMVMDLFDGKVID